ncbi:MAG: succinate-semialdehyde dehydrogenase (NADP(+)) [Acidothermales bacterium]|nr:succinate-semialdehyde dehydrogenase (NADP(+)) [Acidothermales bacterium]
MAVDTRMDRPALPVPPTADRLAELVARARASGTKRLTVVAPYTGETLVELPQSTRKDIAEAYREAGEAQARWARVPPRERARVLLRLHDLVLDRQREVLDLVQWENGKARAHAFEEVADVALSCRYYGRSGPAYLMPRRRAGLVPLLTQVVELHHPVGVVGVVSPWNYPLALGASDTLAALLAGNAVVQRPDPQTSLACLWAAGLAREAGLPDGLWQIVLGSGEQVGSAVLDQADYVMFTGSTRTGRNVAQRAGRRLVGCTLELGGKNPMLVLRDADLDRAAEGAVRACFSSSGQLCISMERVCVAASRYDAFVERFVARIEAMRLGAAFDFSMDMGSLTSQHQLDVVSAHVEDAREQGAHVLTGGVARPDLGPFFYAPTLLANVPGTAKCATEETFGPVVSVVPFRGEDEAVRLANQGDYGLNASVWTTDIARGRDIASRIRAGTVNVNEAYAAAWGSMDAPMGGMGDSGLGRRHGAVGVLKYTEPQTVAVQRVMGLGRPPGVTGEQWATLFTGGLRALKRLGRR